MGKLLNIIIGGVVFNLVTGQLNTAASGAADNVEWELNPINKKDIKVTLRGGKVVGIIKVGLKVTNRNPVSIFLNAYNAVIKRNNNPIGSIATTASIELPTNVSTVVNTDFLVPGTEFINELQTILSGGSLLTPIHIDGQIELSNGLRLPISQKLELFKLT